MMVLIYIIRILSTYWIMHLFFSAFLERKNYRLTWMWLGALAYIVTFFALGISDNVFVNAISSYVIALAIAFVFYKEKLIKLAVFSLLLGFIGIMSDLFVGAIIVTVTYTYLADIGTILSVEIIGIVVNAVIFAFVLLFRKLFKGKRHYDSIRDLLTMTSFLLLSIITMLTVFRMLNIAQIPLAEHIMILFILPALLFSSILLFFQYNSAARRQELEMELTVNKEMERHRQTIIEQHERNIDEKNAIIHDYKNSIMHLTGIIKDPDAAIAYCNELSANYSKQLTQYTFDVNNEILNVILSKLKYDCEQHDIKLDLKIQHTDFSDIKPVDTSNLFGNLFDNAMAACYMMANDKWINVIMSGTEDFLYIEVSNSKCNEVIETSSGFLSTKRGQSKKGKGTDIIKSIALKYGGALNISYDDDSFTCNVFLNRTI